MNQTDFETFIAGLDNVQREENFGYTFFFVGDDHRLPFATLANSDNDYDNMSKLDREGIFRINIGVSKETFKSLLGDYGPDVDYSVLNVFLPHPDYAKQHFICILNPSGETIALTKKLIEEAHSLAVTRFQRLANK